MLLMEGTGIFIILRKVYMYIHPDESPPHLSLVRVRFYFLVSSGHFSKRNQFSTWNKR